MRGKTLGHFHQDHLFKQSLMEQLNPDEPLLLLAKTFPWDFFEGRFAQCFANCGRPAKPIRLMVGLLLLKHIENLSDETLISRWVQNPYYQAFCGFQEFQWKFPCHPTELTYFRRRIGEDGVAEIFKASVLIHKDAAREEEVITDTTVQEKNITFPSDIKLYIKIIGKCRNIARREGISLRRSFAREMHTLARTVRFSKSAKQAQARNKAKKRIKTIAGILLREIRRKLSAEAKKTYADNLEIFEKVLKQVKNTKHKIYSLHEPDVSCIAKGKQGKKYEFGSKASLAITKNSSIIIGVASFQGNPYDGDTLKKTIENIHFNLGKAPARIYADRGYRGREYVETTQVFIPQPPKKDDTPAEKKKARKNFGRRSSIEPVISHVKYDCRLCRNYLKGAAGDAINLYLSAAGFNLRKLDGGATPISLFCIPFDFKGPSHP